VQTFVETPLQKPLQALPSDSQGGRAPCGWPWFGTGAHVPTEPGTSQAWHWPVQAALQHTPSTHRPDRHWFAASQPAPFTRFGSQSGALQKPFASQCASVEQVLRQAVAAQANGKQLTVCRAGQAAALPGQFAATVATPLLQLAARHWLPRKASAGQVPPLVHTSVTSQTPADCRQVAPVLAGCVHAPLPLH
jgi:hypothetical protein